MESGQFARSREVNTLVLIMAAVMILTLMAPKMMETFQLFTISTFQQLGTLRMTPESFIGHYGHFMLTAGTLIFPVMLVSWLPAPKVACEFHPRRLSQSLASSVRGPVLNECSAASRLPSWG